MFSRTLLRAVPRTAARPYSAVASSAGENAFVKEREAIKHHAAGSAELWRKVTFYVAFPAVILGYVNAKWMMDEHEHHIAHIKEENGGELPERVVYPYFNLRHKDYPWGPHTLFYNPHVNIDSTAGEE